MQASRSLKLTDAYLVVGRDVVICEEQQSDGPLRFVFYVDAVAQLACSSEETAIATAIRFSVAFGVCAWWQVAGGDYLLLHGHPACDTTYWNDRAESAIAARLLTTHLRLEREREHLKRMRERLVQLSLRVGAIDAPPQLAKQIAAYQRAVGRLIRSSKRFGNQIDRAERRALARAVRETDHDHAGRRLRDTSTPRQHQRRVPLRIH